MPQSNPRMAIKVYNQPALATPLLLAFVDEHGIDVLTSHDDDIRWDPQTVEMEMAATSGGCLPQNLDKLMVAAEVLGTDHFEVSLPDFIRICNVLADSPTDGTFDPAEVHEIAWAIIETGLLLSRLPEFPPEILGYIQKTLLNEGFTTPPSPIDRVLKDPDAGWKATNQDTEDTDLFIMTQDAAQGREDDLQRYLRERLARMVQEIHALPLTAPQADWVQNLGKELKALLTDEDQSTTS